MKGHLIMSKKEADRVLVLEDYLSGTVTRVAAAAALSLSERQITRIAKDYKESGIKGLIHKARGQPSKRKTDVAEIERLLVIIKGKYHDFRPTLAHEKLVELHKCTLGLETLRKAMIADGLHKPRPRKRPRIHQSRKRREHRGELVQVDGSPHGWFEERGERCTLLVYVDDATGEPMHLEFAQSESTQSYFKATRRYLELHGKPQSFYTDKHSTFRVNSTKGQSASLTDSVGITQFGRAMQELGIELIAANSPEAKGRVEKINSTFQDRLVKELRLVGISTIEEGNLFLPLFTKSYSQKFAREPVSSIDLHRPLLESEDLDTILVEKHRRILTKNLEFQYKNVLYQIQTTRPTYAMRHAPVDVIDSDQTIRVFYKGRELQYKTMLIVRKHKPINRKELDSYLDAKLPNFYQTNSPHETFSLG